jgi:predicted nucleic acid-binding protein
MSARCFLDTNIIVYAYDTSDPAKQATAQALLLEATLNRSGAISTQVLGEFFHTVVIKRKLLAASEVAEIVSALKIGLLVTGITMDMVSDAIALHQRYQLRYWDALIVATAKSLGCPIIMSEDMSDGQNYSGVVVKNPFNS